MTAVMKPEELEAFAHLREVASAWIFVAAGASLIAIKETWTRIASRLRRHRPREG